MFKLGRELQAQIGVTEAKLQDLKSEHSRLATTVANIRRGKSTRGSASSGAPDHPSPSFALGLAAARNLWTPGRSRKRESSSEDSDGVDHKNSKVGGIKGIHTLKKRYRKHPNRWAQGHEIRVKESLGATDPRQACAYRDFRKRLLKTFGKM